MGQSAFGFNVFSGVSGLSGYSGADGTSGYSGANGSEGASGYSGANGSSGSSGYSGTNGSSGYSGYSGTTGSVNAVVTVNSTGGADFTTLNAAIDFVAARKGGTIKITEQLHTYAAGTAKNVSDITFVGGGGDQSGGSGIIFWNSGAGAWTGNNVTFKNMVIRARPGSSGSLLTLTGISGSGGSVLWLDDCQFMIDGSTSPSLATSIFNINSLNSRIYMHNTTCTRTAPGNRSTFSNDLNSEFFMTGRSIFTGSTPKTIYRDAGSSILYGTATTDTLMDISSRVSFTPTTSANWTTSPILVNTALDELAARSGYSGVSGYSGTSGALGSSGYSGTSGVSGSSGYSGISGTSGYSGTVGTSGYSGTSGISGSSGYSGTSGVSGTSGRSGISGYSAISGYSGSSGYSGTATALPSGTIVQYGGTSAPSGWLICDGAAISRTTYSALFSAISTNYGIGDNSSTFNLPDLRGRVPIGNGQGKEDGAGDPVAGTSTRPPAGANLTNRSIGVYGGEEKHAISEAELASHTHTIVAGSSSTGPGIAALVDGTTTVTTNATGSGTSHNTMMKYVTVNYIIRT